jgi:hypothetical protein
MGTRRSRHLNPGSAGAVIALDSRFISGLSDGDLVGTWIDRSGQGNNATQSGAERPTYETAEQGGNPIVNFDGSVDRMVCASFVSLTSSTIIAAGKSAVTTGNDRNIFYFGNAGTLSPNFNWIGIGRNLSTQQWVSGNYNNPADRSVVGATLFNTAANIVTGVTNDGGTNRLFLNSIPEGSQPSVAININTSARPTVGRRGTDATGYWQGQVFSVALYNTSLQPSLRRRLEHATALSFKIPCN